MSNKKEGKNGVYGITLSEKVQNVLPYVDRYKCFGSLYGDYNRYNKFSS